MARRVYNLAYFLMTLSTSLACSGTGKLDSSVTREDETSNLSPGLLGSAFDNRTSQTWSDNAKKSNPSQHSQGISMGTIDRSVMGIIRAHDWFRWLSASLKEQKLESRRRQLEELDATFSVVCSNSTSPTTRKWQPTNTFPLLLCLGKRVGWTLK